MKNFVDKDFENYKDWILMKKIMNMILLQKQKVIMNENYTNILRNKFVNNFIEIIISKKNYNIYPYLYNKKGMNK